MSQELPKGPEEAKEKNWEDMTPDEQAAFEAEMLEEVKRRHPEMLEDEFSPEPRRECGPEVAHLEALMSAFESQHSLEALHAITDLDPRDPEDVAKYPHRERAKTGLIPIVKELNIIEEETDVIPEKLIELKAKYMRFSQAVGIINQGKVDHTRTVK